MHRHLVAVKVGVEGGTNQRVELYSASLDEHRLKRLYRKAMEGGRAVEQDRMLFDNSLKRVPNRGVDALHFLFRVFDVGRFLGFDQPFHDKRLKQLKSHFFRQAALIYLKLGADNDNRTARVVNTFTEQVLAETSLFAAQHLGKRLERTVGRPGHGFATTSVVNQRVDRFLKHALFVADYNVGCRQFHQPAQPVVAVYDASVKVVEVGRSKAPAVKLYHRANIRRDDRYNLEYHPLWAVARFAQRLNNVKPLYNAQFFLAGGGFKLALELRGKLVYIDFGQKLPDGFGSHTDSEVVFVSLIHLAILAFG